MYNLVINGLDVDIDLKLKYNLTLISGDSGTGKTYLLDSIKVEKDRHPGKYDVRLISDLDGMELSSGFSGDVVVMDKVEQYATTNSICDFIASCAEHTHHLIFLRSNIYIPATLFNVAQVIWEMHNGRPKCSLSYAFGDVL